MAVLLLTGILPVLAGAAAASLLLLLGAAMALNLLRGRSHDCGCLGVAKDEAISWALVARNVVLAVTAASVSAIALLPASPGQ